MVFSSDIFCFLFLPVVLFLYCLCPRFLRNTLLLIVSLLFYAWGEKFYVLVMIGSILLNYGFGLAVARCTSRRAAYGVIALTTIVNIGALIWFKYANFFHLAREPIHLPIGISFFTFQALSYVIDVYRGEVKAQKNPFSLGLYISFFPQLIAGPIVRYVTIAGEIDRRHVSLTDFSYGCRRFVIGLAKKLLIANTVAIPADTIFAIDAAGLTAPVAWLGCICYALQIYFDFSGYSDMAIGMGRMFGFHFLENFNFPYYAHSITEFWRRWHISLSTWFRDYLYIPLGGNRHGPLRTYANLILVFLLCGLWHGANWTFVVWGLFHGVFLVLERLVGRSLRERRGGFGKTALPFSHAYVWILLLISWVFFRADTLSHAAYFLQTMAGFGVHPGLPLYSLGYFLNNELLLALMFGFVGSIPFAHALKNRLYEVATKTQSPFVNISNQIGRAVFLMTILILCGLKLAAGTHNPFIYFRF